MPHISRSSLTLLITAWLSGPAAGQEKKDDLPAKEVANSLGMKLVRIDPGKFTMGSPRPAKLPKYFDEWQHEVEITRPFYLGKFEVTQAEYKAIMGSNPSKTKGDRNPVDSVSWNDAREFCTRLSKKEGKEYRLPTEAEWEFACRAGTKTKFAFGDTLTGAQANFDARITLPDGKKGIYKGRTTAVGSYPANAWGLHDMHGNVWEWVEDGYGQNFYKTSPARDPRNGGNIRVLRGGDWLRGSYNCRSASRHSAVPAFRSDVTGFRVAMSIAAPQP